MKLLFVSDIHLRSIDEPSAKKFLQLLDDALKDSALTHVVLVGDIFDLWVGPGEVFFHQFYPILNRCFKLQERGVEIHYFEGNHDFHLRSMFEDELDFRVHIKPFYFTNGTVTVRVEHGDQMDPNDKGYLFLRWLWRTELFTWLAHTLPSWWIAGVGNLLSRKSRQYTSQVKVVNQERALSIVRSHAEKAFRQQPFDLIVSGHLHVADDFQFLSAGQKVRSINLGTWLDKPRAVHININKNEFDINWREV